jgi:hypothetical protein
MATSDSDQKAANARREFLLGAIHHTQAVIGSLESRVPMALVLHGLLFTGLLEITLHIGGIIQHSGGWRIAMMVIVGLTLTAFLISVLALITSITPPLSPTPGVSDPRPLLDDGTVPGLFFPKASDLGLHGKSLIERHRALTVDEVERALSVNLVQLATFRTYKTNLARIGFWWLRVEVVLALIYVVIAGIAALTL